MWEDRLSPQLWFRFQPVLSSVVTTVFRPQVGCAFPTPQSASTNSMLSLVLCIDFLILESHLLSIESGLSSYSPFFLAF